MTRRLELAQALSVLAMMIAGCADDHGLAFGDGGGQPNDGGVHSIVHVPDATSLPDAAAYDAAPAPLCNLANATETRMPLFLHEGQAFAATLTATSGACGCTPEIPAILGSHSLRLELCSCCDACDCVGGSYEASVDGISLPTGATTLSIPHGSASVLVAARSAPEHAVSVAGLRVVGPDSMRTRTGPDLWWVEVSGTDLLCCVSPMPVVYVDPSIAPAPLSITLTARSLAQDPCDCAGRPIPFTAWHSLGVLTAGNYTLTINGLTTTFSVP